MNDLKTQFNPLVLVGRLIIALFLVAMTCLFIVALFLSLRTDGIKDFLPAILAVMFFGIGLQMILKVLIATTKNYIIKDDSILEYDVWTSSTRTIQKIEIKGFSTSVVPYRIWDFKQIIIYLKDGDKIDIMQFAYFNFRKIKPVLMDKEYTYLGHEPYIWKWFNSRVYKFDE